MVVENSNSNITSSSSSSSSGDTNISSSRNDDTDKRTVRSSVTVELDQQRASGKKRPSNIVTKTSDPPTTVTVSLAGVPQSSLLRVAGRR